jgi:hypothetical protein
LFSKEPVAETELTSKPQDDDVNSVVIAELEKAGLPSEVVDKVSLELHRNEDYTSNVAVSRTIEELPSIITTLVDIIKEKEGELNTLKDSHGIWLDVLGTKGNIPHDDVPYHRRANINAILTSLVDDVYHHEYETDEKTGATIFDDFGNPTITQRIAVNVGVEKRNLDSLNNLAIDGNTRNLQGRILGAYGGGTSVGIDGRFEDMLSNAFEGRRKK